MIPEKLTPDQIKTWRLVLVQMIGPFALYMSDSMIEQYRDRIQTIINFADYCDRIESKRETPKQQEPELWPSARIKLNLHNGALTVQQGAKEAYMLAPSSESILQQLPSDVQQKIKSQQFTKVNATVLGNVLLKVEL